MTDAELAASVLTDAFSEPETSKKANFSMTVPDALAAASASQPVLRTL